MANFVSRVPLFFREVKTELTKVSWPTRKELFGATWIVIIITSILTLYIYAIDWVLSMGIEKFIK